MKPFLLLLLACSWVSCLAQSAPADTDTVKLVTVHANGSDVRDVLDQIFTEAGKNYVLQPGNRCALNLNLNKIEFEEALQLICKTAGLKADLQNGIYYVDKAPAKPKVRPAEPEVAFQELIHPMTTSFKKGRYLPASILDKKVTTNLHKTTLKAVLGALYKATHVRFELDPSVPVLRLDAILDHVTLRSALDQITKAAGLSYSLTNRESILIRNASSI